MGYIKKIRNFDHEFGNFQVKFDELKADYFSFKKETTKFLKECNKFGIKLVSIGKKTKKIGCSNSYPFDSDGSVFAAGEVRYNNFPAIWTVLEKLKISGSCGNGQQHSLNDNAKLIEGVYEFKNGVWKQVE